MSEPIDLPDDIHQADGPVLLLAGPGTGKTYQIAKRINYLIDVLEVDPSLITVMTFTSAAALNMRNKISNPNEPDLYIPLEKHPGSICTMHSFGHKIIRENLDGISQRRIPHVVQEPLVQILLGDAAQLCGYERDTAIETAQCRTQGNCIQCDSPKCNVCNKYRELLTRCDAIDHDDQILLAVRLLEANEEVLERYQEQSAHLLVDEYQDINAGQHRLIRMLSAKNPQGLFVVGDDDQSIYSWRGGSPEYIRDFTTDFGESARVVPLSHARRCSKPIQESAIRIVDKDENRIHKRKMTYDSCEEEKVKIHCVPSEIGEARVIRAILEDMEPSESALVLIPNRGFLPILINNLRKSSLEFIGPVPEPGTGLPLLGSLFNWLADEGDSLALRECIEAALNSRRFGVPSGKVKKTEKVEERLSAYKVVSELWGYVGEKHSLWKSLEEASSSSELLGRIHSSLEGLRGHENKEIKPFITEAIDVLDPWRSVSKLKDETQAWINAYEDASSGQSPRIRIMTFQGAKGLEADVICIVGVEEGVIPKSKASDDYVQEQRRVLFVSMTRARSRLHIFHARKRSGGTSFKEFMGQPSSFLDDLINGKYVERIWHSSSAKKKKRV